MTAPTSPSAPPGAPRAHWGGRIAFVLAAAGSAIGLGNIWKFPYITGVNGGGAFVLVYVVCICAVGIPILIAELHIGQRAQKNVVEAFEATHRPGSPWRAVGWLGLASAFLILSFYSVVGGWVLDFLVSSAVQVFVPPTAAELEGELGALFASPGRQLLWHGVFMAGTLGMVWGGLNAGIERWNKIMMPALFVILAGLLVRALFLPGFGQAVRFLFSWDATQLTPRGVLEAVGHSFFTLSLGMGAMLTYGSYLERKGTLVRTAFNVAVLDTLVALMAGLVVFSIVFSFGLKPGAGPSLIFRTLPVLFAQLPGGRVVAVAFFVLVAFAAWTSAMSLVEVAVAYFVEAHGVRRHLAILGFGLVTFGLGVLSALSTNQLAAVTVGGKTFFDLFDKLTSSVMLPVGGLAISLFFGWVLGPRASEAVAGAHPRARPLATALLWLTRAIAPVAVAVMLFNGLRDW